MENTQRTQATFRSRITQEWQTLSLCVTVAQVKSNPGFSQRIDNSEGKVFQSRTGNITNRFPSFHFIFHKLCPACMMVEMPRYEGNVAISCLANGFPVIESFHNSKEPVMLLNTPSDRIHVPGRRKLIPMSACKLIILHFQKSHAGRCLMVKQANIFVFGQHRYGKGLSASK